MAIIMSKVSFLDRRVDIIREAVILWLENREGKDLEWDIGELGSGAIRSWTEEQLAGRAL